MCYNRDMKKLIVKSQLKDREAFLRKATNVGVEFSSTVWQHERVYRPSNYVPKSGFPRLNLMTERQNAEQEGTYSLVLKRHLEKSGVDLMNVTAVADYSETAEIIRQLGYQEVAEVSRQRQEARLDEKTVIYLDVVENLPGTFVKIEVTLSDEDDASRVRQEAFKTLSLFGQDTFILQSYADLMSEQMQPYYLG